MLDEGRLRLEPETPERDVPARPRRETTPEEPEEPEGPPRDPALRIYVVQASDISLMNIARKVYDAAGLWPKIWVANRSILPNPDLILPGMELRIPSKAPLSVEEQRARAEYYR